MSKVTFIAVEEYTGIVKGENSHEIPPSPQLPEVDMSITVVDPAKIGGEGLNQAHQLQWTDPVFNVLGIEAGSLMAPIIYNETFDSRSTSPRIRYEVLMPTVSDVSTEDLAMIMPTVNPEIKMYGAVGAEAALAFSLVPWSRARGDRVPGTMTDLAAAEDHMNTSADAEEKIESSGTLEGDIAMIENVLRGYATLDNANVHRDLDNNTVTLWGVDGDGSIVGLLFAPTMGKDRGEDGIEATERVHGNVFFITSTV